MHLEHLIQLKEEFELEMKRMDKRKINYLVAEKVMGYVRSKYRGQEGWGTPDQHTWYSHFNPTGDISEAWLAVDKLKSNSEFFSLDFEDEVWTCEFGNQYSGMYEVTADTAPMAICKAALKIVGIEIGI
jgi:hypothetical protein